MTDNISALGFNGAYLDSTLDNYHLGNGYRAYNPATMAFTGADDMSPFGHGGINPYVYVSCDPINNTDPSGHFAGFLGAIIGIINMVSPLQVPTSLTATGIEEAVMGTVVNVGVDLATDGLGALATPAVETMDAAFKTMLDDVILESHTEIEDETIQRNNILNSVLDLQQEREIVEPPLQHNSPQFNESAHHDDPGPPRRLPEQLYAQVTADINYTYNDAVNNPMNGLRLWNDGETEYWALTLDDRNIIVSGQTRERLGAFMRHNGWEMSKETLPDWVIARKGAHAWDTHWQNAYMSGPWGNINRVRHMYLYQRPYSGLLNVRF